MTSHEEQLRSAIQEAVARAITEGRETTFVAGQVVGHRDEDQAFTFLRAEGDTAVLEAAGSRASADESLIKRRPLAEIFDANRWLEILKELERRDVHAASAHDPLFADRKTPIEPS